MMTRLRTIATGIQWNRMLTPLVPYYLPLLVNIGLIVYLTWQLNLVPYVQRHGDFQFFSVLYAIGGLVVAVSGATAVVHFTSNPRSSHRLFALSLVNTIIPSVLLLVMLYFR